MIHQPLRRRVRPVVEIEAREIIHKGIANEIITKTLRSTSGEGRWRHRAPCMSFEEAMKYGLVAGYGPLRPKPDPKGDTVLSLVRRKAN